MLISKRLLLPFFVIIIILSSSCSSKFSVTKRHYMKGYHVDFAKKTKSKGNKVETITIEEAKISAPINQNKEIEILLTKTEKTDLLNTLISIKAKKPVIENNGYASANKSRLEKRKIVELLIKNEVKHQSNIRSGKQKKAPFDFFGSGGIASLILYGIMGIIVSAIITFLFFLFFSLLISGGGAFVFPAWLGGLLVLIGIAIVIGIIVVVVINGD